MQTAPSVAAPMVVYTMQSARQGREHYMSKAVQGLSITQITIGALCILFQLVLIGIPSTFSIMGQGIWAGLFFVLTGAFGIASSKRKKTGLIVTFLTLAIISAVLTVGILAVSSNSIKTAVTDYNYGYYDRRHVGRTVYLPLAINAMMLILAVTQAVVAIVSSALGCHGLCGGDKKQAVVVVGQVQCVQGPDGQQQMVILPFDQQGAGLTAGPSSPPDQALLPPYDQQSPPPEYECETKVPIPE